ncbi:MAG: folylpolyglutamate synthase/dihydrofolate synthase family protein [Chloroflexota bacterium]
MSSRYQAALDYLYQFANFEHKQPDRYTADKVDPSRPHRLLEYLGAPHRAFPSLHIAGTKGKGSVAALCASCLRAAGLRVGLYTSPHLQEFRERIRILTPADGDGRISEAQLVERVEELKPVVPLIPGLTWFELVTAVAFAHFAQQQVDVAVVEVGLGGRLDATNVLTPLVSIITSLSLDHTHLLGRTLAEIAAEKGGIIKPGVPVVSAPQPPEALARLEQIAQERNAPLVLVGRDWLYEPLSNDPFRQEMMVYQPVTEDYPKSKIQNPKSKIAIPLAGRHQQENATVALAALSVVQPYFPSLTGAAIQQGMATVRWPGRLQLLPQVEGQPAVLVDCAHNVDSAHKLAAALREQFHYQRLWLIIGVTADKDVPGILAELLPLAHETIVTRANHPRASDPAWLRDVAAALGYEVAVSPTVLEAVHTALQVARPADLVCVTGSIFVVGDLLNQWERLQSGMKRET